MLQNIWDIIISNTDEKIINWCGGRDIGEIAVEEFLQRMVNLVTYYPETGEVRMDSVAEKLCSVLKCEKTTAQELFTAIFNLLQYYYRWDIYDVTNLNAILGGDLAQDVVSESERLYNALICNEMSNSSLQISPVYDLVYDILLPNLYSILLLEASGHQSRETEGKTLSDLLAYSSIDIEYTQLARALKASPDSFKHLFAIKGKSDNQAYQINTRYPNLFLAILSGLDSSPLSDKTTTAESFTYNKRFFDRCIDMIAPDGNWTEGSFAEYYLFERFFRLNTKLQLFWGENRDRFQYPSNGSDTIYTGSVRTNAISCPSLLSDIFFASPLVYFQGTTIADFIYNHGLNETDAELAEAQFLKLIIKLSSEWFPIVLTLFRFHLRLHYKTNYEAIQDFLFPSEDNFALFRKKYTPQCKIKAYETQDGIGRKLKEHYTKGWGVFRRNSVEALDSRHLELWQWKKPPDYYRSQDRHVLKNIQIFFQ